MQLHIHHYILELGMIFFASRLKTKMSRFNQKSLDSSKNDTRMHHGQHKTKRDEVDYHLLLRMLRVVHSKLRALP